MKTKIKSLLLLLLLSTVLINGCGKKTEPPVAQIPETPEPPPPPPPANTGKIYYVSANAGADSQDGLSEAKAFKTLSKATGLTLPGDTVFIMSGTYNSTNGPVLNITRSGTQAQYITYKALPGHQPKITASMNVWNAVSINGSYIIFEGIEMEGNNANITYEAAYASYQDYQNGGRDFTRIAAFNTNGISIGGPNTESKMPHHVIIRNCKVHDFPGGGISSIQADYTTIEGNIVYNNAWYMMYGGSGISILTPFNFDQSTSYKNFVRNNICYNNKTTIPWIGLNPARLSDGNGIIIDINKHTYNNPSGPAFTGRTLVENNVSYNNGGSGIHAYKCLRVDMINNTAYNNGQVVGYPEIFANDCDDVKIYNNIMYARTGGLCNSNNSNVNVVYNYNIYKGDYTVIGGNDRIADPQFIMLSTNPAVANFSLQPSSPAINAGSQITFAPKDILGITRPKGGGVDCGAYEVN